MGIHVYKQLNPFVEATASNNYYLRSGSSETVRMEEICTQISDSSSSSAADVMAVLESFKGVLLRNLSCGRNVELGTIGTLCPSFRSDAADGKSSFSSRDIRLRKVILKLRADYKQALNENLLFDKKQNINRYCPFTPEERRQRIISLFSRSEYAVAAQIQQMNQCSRQTVINDLALLRQSGTVRRLWYGNGVVYKLRESDQDSSVS